MIAEHLEFDMSRSLQILLDVHVTDAKRGLSLALGGPERVPQFARIPYDAHPPAAAASDGFDDHGVADIPRDLRCLLLAFDDAVAAGEHRHARLLHRATGPGLVAHQLDDVRVGTDEADMARLAHLGKVGALGQEAVARVNGVRAG